MKYKRFNTVSLMVSWLIGNEGKELADSYGRRWKYKNYTFYFKDIGTKDVYKEGIGCLHLYQSHFTIVNPDK